ncbi:hypothetical protein NN3_11030 [Nocardia neocaledoniensis NBRC 108232]|uniref:Uncharacterized protein DUF1906 n=1 Tax=Nocardia neocaledoniensis TaxID=236511 RepID=A0A317NX03_9NOCA|nr:DUF1906 domain-containing protein [Nocardia neocaledoniensis]PWV79525.1 uncharacterized protein DUF1906 [Nocardia neocaledoniensis]GEM30096.1 hypothetical protein NN3_11030 [Nocardia neocaledoniensis NBRC 108232]
MRSVPVTRRGFFGFAAAAATVGLGLSSAPARAQTLGTLIDYAAGVPSAAAIKAAGHIGVIRYVSDRRPGAEWMAGKPLLAAEVEDLWRHGLSIVSNYQFGKGPTADWRGGLEAGKQHAERGWALHSAAGGPDTAPIYASIDDNPSEQEFEEMIAPYIEGWQAVLGPDLVGIYANTPTIDRAIDAGLGSWFWQHDWGTPDGYVHPSAHLHQFEIDERAIDGVGIDLNNALAEDYGQW